MQCNKVTLASPIQNLWFILFDRSSGRQSPLTVEPGRNSEDDIGAPGWASFLCYLLLLFIFGLFEECAKFFVEETAESRPKADLHFVLGLLKV